MEKHFESQEQRIVSSVDKESECLKDKLKARVWLISDLQQSQPEKAKRSLYTALEDFNKLGLKCDKIWYMGDSVEGKDIDYLNEMTCMQEEAFEKLNIPLCYVMGNHDMDPMHLGLRPPFYDMVKSHKDWKCVDKCDSFYFKDTIADFDVLFISDHFDKDLSWWACHGRVYGKEEAYPYTKKDVDHLVKELQNSTRQTITVSHYSYPGGNRASSFMAQFMPLPENVFLHIYGHAHIGDKVWAGRDAMRKIAWVDDCDIPQVNISSLERDRGNAVRSAFLEVYDDCVRILFRNHDKKIWTETFSKAIINC